MTITRKRVAGVVLLRDPDGAALLQHRDDALAVPQAWVAAREPVGAARRALR